MARCTRPSNFGALWVTPTRRAAHLMLLDESRSGCIGALLYNWAAVVYASPPPRAALPSPPLTDAQAAVRLQAAVRGACLRRGPLGRAVRAMLRERARALTLERLYMRHSLDRT